MGIFKSLGKAVINTATLPLSAVADVVTLGGLNTDQDDPYTVQNARRIKNNLKKVRRSLDD